MPNSEFSRRSFLQTAGLAVAGSALASDIAVADQAPPKIKIGQIGTAHMHANKINSLRRLTDQFEVVGIADNNPEHRKQHENKGVYKDLPWMSVDELLAVPGLRAVAVEVDERYPLPFALRCVEAGLHVHIDKPAGESLSEYKKILDIAREKKLAVQVGYMYRNNPAMQFCIKAVRDGLIGEVYDLDAAMNGYGENPGFRNVIKRYRGGTPYIFTCHLIDLALSIMGKPEKIVPFLRRTRDDGVIDNSLTVFEYPKGGIATLRTSINEIMGPPHRYLVVRGSKGVITIRPLEGARPEGVLYLALLQDTGEYKKGEHVIKLPENKDRYAGQWIEFGNVISGTMENPYSYDHEYLIQQCLLEACEMAQ